jgi:hypothetical protein
MNKTWGAKNTLRFILFSFIVPLNLFFRVGIDRGANAADVEKSIAMTNTLRSRRYMIFSIYSSNSRNSFEVSDKVNVWRGAAVVTIHDVTYRLESSEI